MILMLVCSSPSRSLQRHHQLSERQTLHREHLPWSEYMISMLHRGVTKISHLMRLLVFLVDNVVLGSTGLRTEGVTILDSLWRRRQYIVR